MRQKDHAVLLTEGPIAQRLIAFAIPLFLSNLFQQMYNAADSLIVGNFLGREALAAVSSSGNLIFMMVSLISGISSGASIAIARYYGARDTDNLKRIVHTLFALGLLSGLFMTVFGVLCSPMLLKLIGTPPEVLPNSIGYFRAYFLGSLAFVLYNAGLSILHAVGDSRQPLLYLIISSIVNIILDVLFIGVFGWGVASAAAATAISQFVSMVLCLYRLIHSKQEYRLNLRMVHIDKDALAEILRNGIPAGLTNSIVSFANVVIQANINAFGAAAMAGCGAYSRIEGFAFLPVNCFTMALSTYVGQNLGAKKYDRVKKGVYIGVGCATIIAETVALFVYAFSPALIRLFASDPEVIAYGVMHQRTIAPFFCLVAYSHAMASIFRGAGKATVPLGVMLVCWCLVRVTYVTIAVKFVPVLSTVSWAYPITWSLSTIVYTIYYFKSDWMYNYEKQEKNA